MVSHLSSQDCERFLVHLLTPVYHLVEDDTIKDSRMGEHSVFSSTLTR
jgi:U3 small nucleolar RNA-associated protein 20